MVQVGDKYKERMPFGIDNVFSWDYTVVGFKTEKCGEFAQCIRTLESGEQEPVGVAIELLESDSCFKKVE